MPILNYSLPEGLFYKVTIQSKTYIHNEYYTIMPYHSIIQYCIYMIWKMHSLCHSPPKYTSIKPVSPPGPRWPSLFSSRPHSSAVGFFFLSLIISVTRLMQLFPDCPSKSLINCFCFSPSPPRPPSHPSLTFAGRDRQWGRRGGTTEGRRESFFKPVIRLLALPLPPTEGAHLNYFFFGQFLCLLELPPTSCLGFCHVKLILVVRIKDSQTGTITASSSHWGESHFLPMKPKSCRSSSEINQIKKLSGIH